MTVAGQTISVWQGAADGRPRARSLDPVTPFDSMARPDRMARPDSVGPLIASRRPGLVDRLGATVWFGVAAWPDVAACGGAVERSGVGPIGREG